MRQRQPATCGVEIATTFTAVSPMGTGRYGSRAARRGTRKAWRPRPGFTREGDGPPPQPPYTKPWCPCAGFWFHPHRRGRGTPRAPPEKGLYVIRDGRASHVSSLVTRRSRPRRRGHRPPRSPLPCLPLCLALRSRRSFALTRHPPDVADGVDLP